MTEVSIKQTKGKRNPKHVPIRAIESILKIREFGNLKYTNESFYQVPAWQHIDAAFRHLMDVFKAENYFEPDPESGMLHIEHALTDLAGAVEIYHKALDKVSK